jgi:parvulin-like peptidyl-prolyl cis-trans isomerase-like protein
VRRLLFGLVMSCACGRQEKGPPRPDTGPRPLDARAQPGDTAVALLDGTPILASEVARQARLAGTTARAALDQIVGIDLLAAEAARRGLAGDPDVCDQARRAAVRRFLEETFERDFLPESVPDADLRARYETERSRFVHPELRHVLHAVAQPPPSPTDAQRRVALERAQRVAQETAHARTPEEFRRLAESLSDDTQPVRVEELTTARHGYTVEDFARAAFAISRPGSKTGVVRTSFGYHVIYLLSIDPPADRPFADVRAQLLDEAWPELRERAFSRFMDDLVRRHRVVVHDLPAEGPARSGG